MAKYIFGFAGLAIIGLILQRVGWVYSVKYKFEDKKFTIFFCIGAICVLGAVLACAVCWDNNFFLRDM